MSKTLIIGASLFFLAACSGDGTETQMKSLDGRWDKKAEQKFLLNIDDAPAPKNIIFVVRNNEDYAFSNIRFIVNLKNLEEKKTTTDTLNYIMARPNGEWIGTGFGDTKEILFQYKTDYQFPKNGAYEIGIIQAMRKDTLVGIEDVGIKIETTKP